MHEYWSGTKVEEEDQKRAPSRHARQMTDIFTWIQYFASYVSVLTGRFADIVPELMAYRIAGNYRGVQFSRKASLQSFRSLIFADVGDYAHYTLYYRTYFAGLIFADSRLSAKTTKIRPHENFLLYGIW
jgi:hypothetical protein